MNIYSVALLLSSVYFFLHIKLFSLRIPWQFVSFEAPNIGFGSRSKELSSSLPSQIVAAKISRREKIPWKSTDNAITEEKIPPQRSKSLEFGRSMGCVLAHAPSQELTQVAVSIVMPDINSG